MPLPPDYPERVCAGVLGKVIGTYLGRSFEGWPYDSIRKRLGDIEKRESTEIAVPQPADEVIGRQHVDAIIRPARPGLQADHDAAADFRVVLDEAPEPLQVVTAHPRAGLRFHGQLHVAKDEVDFRAAGKAPVRQGAVTGAVADERREFVVNPVLEGMAVGLRPAFQQAPASQTVHDADIREVELRGLDHAALRLLPVGRQPVAEQGVLENPEVGPDGVTGDAAVASDVREVDNSPVAQRGGVEEVAEGGERPDRTFDRDLLPQVVRNPS